MNMTKAQVRENVLFRQELGDVLREYRQRQGRTLRDVSSEARVSLGYLSEVERGQKEASSELLASIATALNVPLSHVLRLVADRIDIAEGRPTPAMKRRMAQQIPDTLPPELVKAELAKIRA
ncbi:transcriptional regulator with XRE-family HTH domain [Arcanobacterium wilhelmae]|uniref:Transcriptional regulator with XRE-family HTH domain n=1 Tax=Arcanobacterium wilhelmae TaxID=1803177 RepID=A0ABT9N998_9ACTO|nr:helix-turn-helix transcriptional regulator [Arcanobacterium wilhelmae]MDP9800276.1 transcriptional regulator with XRE-family HTH domain [Arcanobacterium wilhelmae]WFN89714.1 helix-turn-helix transcriptional regulator [Arcanobacterium wilhelmae]